MWKLGDIVNYGSHGICKIEDIRDELFAGEVKKYFILKPIFDEKNTFFVPSFNETLMSRIRPVLSKDEALSLVKDMSKIEPEWVDNDKLRQEKYKEIMESGQRDRIVAMLKALYNRRKELIAKGKKMRTSDEVAMRHAEGLIENECAYIFDMPRSEVQSFIAENNC